MELQSLLSTLQFHYHSFQLYSLIYILIVIILSMQKFYMNGLT